jgi:glycosyltransferase involved in cell wall biosynthesis
VPDNLLNGQNRMMPVDRKPVVVSLTPLPLSADSRTLKQVTSVHRFGFKSIVIEGRESGLTPGTVPFEVISIHARDNSGASSTKVSHNGTSESGALSSADASETVDICSLSRLRQVSFARFAVRYIPGCGKTVDVFESALDRAIASRRGAVRTAKQVSTKEIIGALPRAVGLFMSAVAIRVAASPLAFTQHLRIYLNQYFFRVLSVAPRADLYYLHAFYQFPAVCILCIRYRAKMIYDAHDFYSQLEDDASFSSYWKNWVMPFERAVERACVWFASDVVTVNEGIAALMRKRFGCEPVILRNVHDLRLDCQPARTIREAIGLPPDAFLVVSIGNWKKGMAMEQMFDALAQLPKRVHLAFLGSGYPSLDDATTSRGIQGRVHLVRPVLPQEVVPFVASADASVVLYYGKSINYQNALPNRFFQSIAARLPLVYPDLNEIRCLADRYGMGIMANPQQPIEIESALRTLIEDNERRDVIRRNLQLASRELCWESEEQVLRDLLNRHLRKAEVQLPTIEDRLVS